MGSRFTRRRAGATDGRLPGCAANAAGFTSLRMSSRSGVSRRKAMRRIRPAGRIGLAETFQVASNPMFRRPARHGDLPALIGFDTDDGLGVRRSWCLTISKAWGLLGCAAPPPSGAICQRAGDEQISPVSRSAYPCADCLMTHHNAALSEQILDIAVS